MHVNISNHYSRTLQTGRQTDPIMCMTIQCNAV